MTTRKGSERSSSPVVRLALVIAGIGIVIVIISVVGYWAFRSSRSTPLSVPVYPDAAMVGQEDLGEGQDRLLYSTLAPAEDVAAFYQREVGGCTRIDNPAPAAGEPPFSLRCVMDASSLFVTQYTTITVQPGVGVDAGQTLIQIIRVWGQ
ncbi:MAG: hypothetical protein JW910_04780 [Anaerolineae bacterium]|nr:hypothetical protein [Anaerolineae bacterium]